MFPALLPQNLRERGAYFRPTRGGSLAHKKDCLLGETALFAWGVGLCKKREQECAGG